jgi:hypothetical protein
MIKNYVKLIIALVFASNVMAQNVPNYVPKNGLVGYWPFNGNANDESGNGYHGTNNGATLTADRNGKVNSAYNFDGNSNFIQMPENSAFSPATITVSVWFKIMGNKSDQILIRRRASGFSINYNLTYSYGSPAQNKIATSLYVGDNKAYSNIVNNSIDNSWHNLILTYDGLLYSTYFDGINVYKSSANGNGSLYTQGLEFTLGRDGGNPNYYYQGLLDDIAIYNRALSQQEITALYTGSNQSALASTKVFVDAPATVNQNQEVEMSISTEALNTADNVIAYQTDLSYDPTRYTYVGSNLTGTLNPNGSVDINSSNNGLLKIGYMTQTALNGAGSLVKLKFKANNTLGQGIFGLSDFMYNNTTITSLKSDTVNTIDGIPPTGRISYSQNPVRKGDSLLITVKFNEKMAVSPIPQLNLSGQNTLPNTNLTKVDDTTYTYWWVVEKGNGAVNVTLATGQDLGGNAIVATPTQNPTFTVLPTLFGDVDTNTYVRAYDAALALQYSVGLDPLPTMDPLPWSNWRIAVANVDTVGNITANDASLILQKSIGKIATFPADDKKRGGDAPVANVSVTQEGNQLVFRTTGTLYAFNVFMKDNFNVLGQPDVKNKSAMLATNINATTYNVGLASTTPFTENEPFLVIPILTNENVQGTMDIVANSQERSLSYGKAAGITAINTEAVIVYPNPTKDIVTINNAQGNTLRIIDAQGKEVYNQKVTTSTMDLSMKTLGSKGMYVLHIVDANNESVQTKQIVLE